MGSLCLDTAPKTQNSKTMQDRQANSSNQEHQYFGRTENVTRSNWTLASQNEIPLKKRLSPEVMAESEEEYEAPGHPVSILPGVIRHTSCPHISLAYYYNYKKI